MKGSDRRARTEFSFVGMCALVLLTLPSPRAVAELVLFDEFEYAVGRTEPNSTALPKFSAAGWTWAKRLPTDTGSQGYLYTVTQTEMQATTGYSGPLPGGGSRVLKMENPAGSPQSDFYLELSGGENTIPANVWFQFWIYSNHFGQETGGLVNRHKFLYPSNDGYGSHTDKWLLTFSSWSATPLDARPDGDPTNGSFFVISRDQMQGRPWYNATSDNNDKLGPNLLSAAEAKVAANQWVQVKVHYDTSVADRGVFECWIRPYGGSWRKTAEWIGGVTPNFTWTGYTPGGHRSLRMPTTIPGTAGSVNTTGSFYYLDDFAMATSEDSLPDSNVTRPRSPTSVSVD